MVSHIVAKPGGLREKEVTGNKTGVLWSGDHVYDGIPETIELLRSKGQAESINHPFRRSVTEE